MKKMLSLALALALAAGLLAGCGSASSAAAPAASAAGAAALTGSVGTNGSTSMESVIGGLSEAFMNANPGVKVLHPGPINRGVEIASDLADAGNSLILDQVSSGVAVRMAILYLHITRKDKGAQP